MDIRSLSCFVAVADELHFRKAARKLHLTQPALSQRIRALEHEVGAELLVRDRRSVALSAAGAAFLPPARAAVEQAALARRAALRAVRGEVGHLRLGFTVIAFFGALPEAVRKFRARYPDVAVELREMNSPSVESALAMGEIDLGILHPPISANLITSALAPQRMLLALPARHRLAGKTTIAVSDLKDEPFLVAPRTVGPSIYDRLIGLFQGAGISPRIVQEVTPVTTLTGLVAAGTGLGFVTEGIAHAGRPGVVFRPVRPAAPSLPMAAAWRPPVLSASGERFLEIVRTVTAKD
jgi:DNA-binding transcriptional LysR family regulator